MLKVLEEARYTQLAPAKKYWNLSRVKQHSIMIETGALAEGFIPIRPVQSPLLVCLLMLRTQDTG